MNAIERAIQRVGSQASLARALGVAQQVVNNWLRRGNVPAAHCPSIEKATAGLVTCEELRPDVDWAYLRASRCDVPEREAA
jgi:DNA-binding transcriptional regulator YdaS (Cro superfamily)